MVWQRARSEDQKEQRRAVLLDAATRLFEARGLEQVSLNLIAREANISKANVYRYFESREQLFLHLTLDSVDAWAGALSRRLDELRASGDAQAVACAVTATTLEHPRMARLSSVLSTVLERNVSTETVVWFKTAFQQVVVELLRAVRGALPDFTKGEAFELLEACYFNMIGMWPAAHPAPAVQEALKRPELRAACVHFESAFGRAVHRSILGIRAARELGPSTEVLAGLSLTEAPTCSNAADTEATKRPVQGHPVERPCDLKTRARTTPPGRSGC